MKVYSVCNGSSVSTAVKEEGRGYRCRCTSFPFYDGLLLLIITAFHRRPVKVDGSLFFQTITGAKVRFFFSIFTTRPSISSLFLLLLLHGLAFPHFFSTFTTRPCISSLSQRPPGHESRRFSCQCRVKEVSLQIS